MSLTRIRQALLRRPGLAKVLANFSWLMVDRAVRLGLGLLVGVWVARHLGPNQFGQLSYATAFAGLFGAIANAGMNGVVVRDLVKHPEQAASILGSATLLQLTGALLALVAMSIGIILIRPDDGVTLVMVLIIGSSYLFKATETVKYWFEARLQSRYAVVVENLVFVLISALKLALILSQAPLLDFAWVVLAEAVFVAAGLLTICWHHGIPPQTWRAQTARARQLLSDSWPLVLSGLAISIYMQLDQIMLGDMAGEREVGQYAAAMRVAVALYFLPTAIMSSVFPSVMAAKRQGPAPYAARMQQLFDIMVVIAILFALPTSLLSGWIMRALYGSAFADTGGLLSVLVWASIFNFLGVASSRWFVIEGLQRSLFARSALGALTNVLLNLVLIPRWGGLGAAWATIISYMAANWLFLAFQERTRALFFTSLRSLTLVSPLTTLLRKARTPHDSL